LGIVSRERGQSRVPDPPAMMMGQICDDGISRFSSGTGNVDKALGSQIAQHKPCRTAGTGFAHGYYDQLAVRPEEEAGQKA